MLGPLHWAPWRVRGGRLTVEGLLCQAVLPALQYLGSLAPRRRPGGAALVRLLCNEGTETRGQLGSQGQRRFQDVSWEHSGWSGVWALRCSLDPAPRCPRFGQGVSAVSSLWGAGGRLLRPGGQPGSCPCTVAHCHSATAARGLCIPLSSGTNGPLSPFPPSRPDRPLLSTR